MRVVLLLNDAFEIGDRPFRLVHIAKAIDAAYTVQMDRANSDPFRWKLSELNSLADENNSALRLLPELTSPGRSHRPRAHAGLPGHLDR